MSNESQDLDSDPSANAKYRLGFDLGGTKMLAVLYDAQWNQVGRRRKRTKSGDAKAGVRRIIQVIEIDCIRWAS